MSDVVGEGIPAWGRALLERVVRLEGRVDAGASLLSGGNVDGLSLTGRVERLERDALGMVICALCGNRKKVLEMSGDQGRLVPCPECVTDAGFRPVVMD